ncbi:MAG: protein phosphatase 2C domain-containing protein [Pseudomonadota bacterium]
MKSDAHLHFQVETSLITATGISDAGHVRSENEDSILLDEAGNFMLLADGMGGHERGGEASQAALQVIQEYFQPEVVKEKLMDITKVEGVPAEIVCLSTLAGEAVDEANSVLYTRNKQAQLKRFMGTTVVGLVPAKEGEYMFWFHVGDSRLYRWRNSKLECLTSDHSAYAEWVNQGQEGTKPSKNIITKAIGPKVALSADTGWAKRQQGDIYILCSDGLSDMITDDQIAEILMVADTVDNIATRLVEAAKDAGGKDNTSVIVCRV